MSDAGAGWNWCLSPEEQAELNRIGGTTGCHICGTTYPGTRMGNFVADLQAPDLFNRSGRAQHFYPKCVVCCATQGLWISDYVKRGAVRVITRKFAPFNAMFLIDDSYLGERPEALPLTRIAATPSCLAVGCLMAQEGYTEITLGPATEVPLEGKIAFDGILETPNRTVWLSTADGIVLTRQAVDAVTTRVRVWTDHPYEPSRIVVGVGEDAPPLNEDSEEATITRTVAAPYSLIVIDDSWEGISADMAHPLQLLPVMATSSRLLVRCLMFQDGTTEIILGAADDVPQEGTLAFDGAIDTPNGMVWIGTV